MQFLNQSCFTNKGKKKKSGNLYVELNKNKGRKEISVFAFDEIKGCELPY